MKQNINFSFEVFPPKKDGDFNSAFDIMDKLSGLSPEFISVTYGAGGSRKGQTLEIASYIQNKLNIEAMAHFTCVGSTRRDIIDMCESFKRNNIKNILALRGDRPKDMTDEQYNSREFSYASELIKFLADNTGLNIAAACYPEKHFESKSIEDDLIYMKEKQDLGVKFFITQMFFDNDLFYRFRDMALKKGIKVPIHTGIMPITAVKQLGTSVSLSGSSVPKALADIIAIYGDNPNDMRRAGIEYAVNQIRGLIKNDVHNIHIYTMNKPETASEIISGI